VYLHKYEVDNTLTKLSAVGNYDLGVYPKLKANLTSLWQAKTMDAGFNVRYIGGYKECSGSNCNDPTNLLMYSRDVDANITADIFAGYTVKSKLGTTRYTVGVNNLTDQAPPLIYVGFQGDSDASTYDYMGRFFYMRLSQLF
jgi:outer membrane receptor protein involved in Fe transport